jgi:pyrroloquinoline quinone (PQQ) biosynthesis protein C
MTTVYDRLVARTQKEREAFMAIPVIRRALAGDVDRDLYLRFLGQAYHHVSQTVPLLASALARTGPREEVLRDALISYIDEEKGHDEWILEDIAALGGDAGTVRRARPGQACRIMCGHACHLIGSQGPWALLGMVHVLEGMSVALAGQVADVLEQTLRPAGGAGFSYLTSHGALDQEHVRFFETLVNGITEPEVEDLVTEAARDFYLLYGNVLREVETEEVSHAA